MSSKDRSFYGITKRKPSSRKSERSQKELKVLMFHRVGVLQLLEGLIRFRIR